MSETQIHYRTCNICEAMCGIAVEHEHGQVLTVIPYADSVGVYLGNPNVHN